MRGLVQLGGFLMALMPKPCPERTDLAALVKRAVAAFEALSPEQQKEVRRAQRKSWGVGETMLSHPEMTREEAEALNEKVCY